MFIIIRHRFKQCFEQKSVRNGAMVDKEQASTTNTNSESSNNTMVIDLEQYSAEKRGVQKVRGADNPCVNFSCASGVDIREAPMFCLSYYCIKVKPSKVQMVCNECYTAALLYYDTQVGALAEEIIDSDEDEEQETDTETGQLQQNGDGGAVRPVGAETTQDELFTEDAEKYIMESLPNIIDEMTDKYKMDTQIAYSCSKAEHGIKKLGGTLDELEDIHKTLQDKVDKLRKQLYSNFKTDIKSLPPIELVDIITAHPSSKYIAPAVSPGNKRTSPVAARGSTSIALASPIMSLTSTPPVMYPRPVREAERRSHRNISKPASYLEPSDDVELPMSAPVVETDIQVVSVTTDGALQADSRLDLPPRGPVQRPRPLIGEQYYAMRQSVFGAWGRVRLLEIMPAADTNGSTGIVYRVRFDGKGKGQNLIKIVHGKQLAYAHPCAVRLEVGTRVIAVFRDESSLKRDSYFTGVVAEPLCHANSYRYLVFFDDGYAQYVRHDKVMVVVECSRHVWDDIHPDSRLFIRKYLEKYPERPMVKLQSGQVVKTEWNGKWWIARVVRVEGSLVQMYFDADARSEWIYRGSARLGPLFLEMQAATNRQEKGPHIAKIQPNAKKNLPYVEYTRNDGLRNGNATASGAGAATADTSITTTITTVPNIPAATTITIVNEPPPPPAATTILPPAPRAVARKSTNRPANTLPTPSYAPYPYINHCNMVPFLPTPQVQQPQSKVVYYTPKTIIAPKPYVPHVCSPDCKKYVTLSLSQLKGYNPLSKPLLCGWYRQVCKFKGKKIVRYRAPCARILRTMKELHEYLRLTASEMSVDMFDFEFWVHCLAEFVLDKSYRSKRDISNGVEHVPIPCVNYVDNTMPDFTNYSTKREPMEGTARPVNKRTPDDLIGYSYKRLTDFVTSGIYECNSRCKCASTCLNRVVQHPLQLKLQLFKTANRGWGIRCLNDIPQGAFICIYAGSLLTDKMANEGGVNYGDEYLAELDYIEVVERQKEGYESDVEDIDDDGGKTSSSPSTTLGADDSSNGSLATNGKMPRTSESQFKEPTKPSDDETVTISDDDENVREPSRFDPSSETNMDDSFVSKFKSVRKMFGEDEVCYIMDAKNTGNIGRFLNHSCSPNVFVQNVFVDTHDLRFPWVAFFAMNYIRAGTELTWNYNYDVGSVPNKVIFCHCGSPECRGRLL
ncbi:eggless [Carabus blaptoides fortunei]